MHRRAAILVWATAFVFLIAAAAGPEIPKKYLDEEARIRSAMTPAELARVNARVAVLSPKLSLQDVKTMSGNDGAGAMFVFMMEYLKMLQKEAREDRKLARADAELSLSTKAGKLDQENSKIAAQKREAEARFENAMAAANLEMMMGLVSGGAARVVAPGTVRVVALPTRTPTRTPAAGK